MSAGGLHHRLETAATELVRCERAASSTTASILSASTEIRDALDELRAATRDLRDPQRVLSALVRMTPERLSSALACKSNATVSVKAKSVDLAALEHVELLRDVTREFAGEKEVQRALCDVLASVSRMSRRFQRQAGRLELWRELSHVRALHPASRRVLIGSLRATTAILCDCDLNTMTLLSSSSLPSSSGPAAAATELLVEELLQLLSRFGGRSGSSDAIVKAAGQREVDAEIAVTAVRLLATLISGPSNGSGDPLSVLLRRFSASIASALLLNLTLFRDAGGCNDVGDDDDPMLTWLAACRELTRLLPPADTRRLFFQPSSPSSIDEAPSPWYELILVDCRERVARHQDCRHRRVLFVYLAITTRLFALPHSRDDEECASVLTSILSGRPRVVDALCALVSEYHHRTGSNNSSSTSRNDDAVTLLELLRLVHLWCERASGAKSMAKNVSVNETLAPVLAGIVERLITQRDSPEDANRRGSAIDRVVTAQTQLAALLTTQRLALTAGGGPQVLRRVLQQAVSPTPSEQQQAMPLRIARSPSLVPTIRQSRRQPTATADCDGARDSTTTSPLGLASEAIRALTLPSDGYDDDLSLSALIARELTSTVTLFTPLEQNLVGSVSKSSLVKPRGVLSSPLSAHFQRRKRGSGHHHRLKTSTVAIYTNHV